MKRLSMITLMLGTAALLPAAAVAQNDPSPQGAPNAAAGAQAKAGQTAPGIPASRLDDQSVYNAAGQEIGSIDNIVVGRNDEAYAVVALDTSLGAGDRTVLVPVSRLVQQNDRFVALGYSAAQFRQLPVYTKNAGYRIAQADQPIELGGPNQRTALAQSGQNGSQIVVHEPAPQVAVNQAAPQVVVRQAQPDVTVHQPQPEVTVHQPAPVVRVEIPQPEITIRMPPPAVNVAQAAPQVQVHQPQPQVQVVQPQQQPQVQVQRAQPQVAIERQANAQANVQVQSAGQPVVHYDQAKPQVIVNQAQGQPKVNVIETGQQANAAAPEPNQQQANAAPAAAASRTEAQREMLRQRLNSGDVENTASVNANANAPTQPMRVSDLRGMTVYNAKGNDLGTVDRVILDTANHRDYVVISSGGFLGIGADRVAFPLDHFWRRGDRLVIRGVTKADINDMDNWKTQIQNHQTLNDNQSADVRIWQG